MNGAAKAEMSKFRVSSGLTQCESEPDFLDPRNQIGGRFESNCNLKAYDVSRKPRAVARWRM